MITRAAWARIDGPAQSYRHLGVVSEATYRTTQVRMLAERGITSHHDDERPMRAYVNHGRWIIDCPCMNGVIVSREWGSACCFACGAVYVTLAFPAESDAIEAALLARPYRHQQNWFPGETVADLQRENAAYGVV